MRIFSALRVFWRLLGDARFAEQVQRLMAQSTGSGDAAAAAGADLSGPSRGAAAATSPGSSAATRAAGGTKPRRSDAISLLATLQREARFVDIVMEPLQDYSDEQVGAAARDVLKNCGDVLQRVFGLEPAVKVAEGSLFETPVDVDAGCYRLTGNVSGQPPYRGQVAHHGWRAAKCELATWSGSEQAALMIAPVEVEVP